MTITWDATSEVTPFFGSAPPYIVAGSFESPVLVPGELYNFWDDLMSSPPPTSFQSIESSWVTIRAALYLMPPLPHVCSRRGFPPRWDYGTVAIGVGPVYISKLIYINWANQFLGYFNPMLRDVMPDEMYNVTTPLPPDSLGRPWETVIRPPSIGAVDVMDPGSVFFIDGPPELKVVITGAIMASPVNDGSSPLSMVMHPYII